MGITKIEKQKRENMNEKELAPHLEDIKRALKGKVSEDEILDEFRNFQTYGVSLENAKRAIVKKFYGDPSLLSVSTEKKISDVRGDEKGLDLKARILSIQDKTIEVEGNEKVIFYGILGDDTGTIPFTLWESMEISLEKGDTIHVKNAYANLWNEQAQINIGSRSGIKLLDPDEVPSFETEQQVCDIIDIREGMRNLVVTARVLQVEKKVVQTDNGEKDLYTGVLADETGKVQFSAWHDYGINEDNVLRIAGGYIRSWRGVPQLNFDDGADVEFLEGSELPSMDDLRDSTLLTISQLARIGGSVDAIIDAVMIDIKTGSGLIFRCNECNRVVQKGACRIHGKVEGEADLRVKGIIDDGTGALTVIITRELTEEILGYDVEHAKEIARDRMDQEAVKDELEEKLIAQPLRVRGNVTSDEYGLMMVATDVNFKTVDVEAEARKLLDEVCV